MSFSRAFSSAFDVTATAEGSPASYDPRFCPDAWFGEACECAVYDGLPEERQSLIAEMAAYILWKATGSRFGPCPTVVRPCADSRVSCARCGGSGCWTPMCHCYSVPQITLPGPIFEVTRVLVDGEVKLASEYRVDDYHWLVNLTDSWPFCQRMEDPFDGPDAFTVEYKIGLPPPAGASLVTSELACELAKAFCGDASCQLPKRVASKTRQGVQVTYADLEEGKTGITSVDMWVSAANNKLRPSRVFSPDLPQHHVTTWPTPAP